MKKKVFILFWVWAIFFPPNVWAENKFVNLVWGPNSDVQATVGNIEFGDNNNSSKSFILRLPGDTRPMSVIRHHCTVSSISHETSGFQRMWFQFDDSWISHVSGLKYRLRSGGNTNWIQHSRNNNLITMRSRGAVMSYKGANCVDLGFSTNVGPFSGDVLAVSLIIEVDKATAVPGHYNINIPFKWLFEEVKGTGNGHFELDGNAMATFSSLPSQSIPVSVDVTSRCTLSTYDTINLSHGRMSPTEAVGHKSRPYSININCSGAVSARLKLSGSSPISDASPNLTQCGPNGSCELLFDNNTYNQKIIIDRSKNISISSTYTPIGKIKEGLFNGSGILTFEVL